ncbi:thioesterase domain-containing protein [Microvirga lotononidis]|uniref:Thioesterase of type I polyketide synthase or non-ribosomal peptide synthase like protein n=1 Tax=Microvirga lotononidis TaxID=864069 RepID=I4YYB1_9HYPH|nr:thioesterase domain-containing protein [Microvirga lotononidis]EIM28953.1 thioesterase of type I polyketide synthase or non-ribosomal peptide synthase like protein [Microvirga lotononidis]WQO26871.1 thioesterase domain-containing protein [Microvirga lotononidis]
MNTAATKIPDFLSDLAGRDIKVWLEGSQLRCSAPAGALTAEFRDQLRERKSEIIGFLNMAAAAARQQPSIVPLQPHGTRTPIYAVPGHGGVVFSFSDLAKRLGDDQPFFALEPPGLDGRTEPMERVEDIAEYFARQILEFQPAGPYIIAGYCSGASTAFELAKLLGQRGAEVECLALFGPVHPSTYQAASRLMFFQGKRRIGAVIHHLRKAAAMPSMEAFLQHLGDRARYLGTRLRNRSNGLRPLLAYLGAEGDKVKPDPVLARRSRLEATATTAVRRYTPTSYQGRICIFLPNKAWVRSGARPLRWLDVAPQAEFYYGPKSCYGPLMLQEPDAPSIAELYRQSAR